MKPDAAAIEAHVKELTRKPGFAGTNRRNWPLYLFRVDNVTAAASILQQGVLYSRNKALELDLLDHDSASPEVIGNSPEWIKEYVRLYFRPRTPTEYRSEGFRPQSQLEIGAHRPMPIVLIFSSIPILTATGTVFTSGNAATWHADRGDDIKFFRGIPFESVYHDSAFRGSEKREIVHRRCAEVLVPHQLDLEHLKHIFCRSRAEYETLLDLLPSATRKIFSKRIGISDRVHHRRWSFVESVDMTENRIRIQFSPASMTPGPFDTRVVISDLAGKQLGRWRDAAFTANGTLGFPLQKLGNPTAYRLSITLDGALAYQGHFSAIETLL